MSLRIHMLSSLMLVCLLMPDPAAGAEMIYRQKNDPRGGRAPVATADGKPFITAHEMHQENSIHYYTLALQLHTRQRMYLRTRIGEKLLELEAARRGVSVEELVRTQAAPDPVSDAIIAQFLSERGRPGAKLTDEERRYLEEERRAVARSRYIDTLHKEANIQISLPEPDFPQVIASEGTTSPVLGIEDGPVNLIEFCAFTSVSCRDTWKTLRELVGKHGWRLRIVHRDFPLPNAPASMTAAIAGRCAHRQGKFWPYHDTLYENQDRLDEASLKGYARQLGLDMARFEQCLDKRETAQEIEWDLMEGRRIRLPALPGLIANTIYLPPGLSPDRLKGYLESQMSKP